MHRFRDAPCRLLSRFERIFRNKNAEFDFAFRFDWGLQEDKVSEVEQELNSAQIREESTQAIFDGIATRMALDFARFQVTS